MDKIRLHWRPSYESGHTELDRQHRALFTLANTALEKLARKEPIGDLIDAIIADVVVHFAAEERILLELGYAEVEEHAAEHRRLLAEIATLKGRMSGTGGVQTELLEILAFGVIAAHVLDSDRRYFEHLQRSGRSARPA